MESVFSGELGRECQVAAACRLTIGRRSKEPRFPAHVAGPLDCPTIIMLEQDGADEAGNGVFGGEDVRRPRFGA